ncbi:MAG TPA: MMPL family transporter [Chondromyces sp.]|nr:MMPL family transporter [Chondromyces sp.]
MSRGLLPRQLPLFLVRVGRRSPATVLGIALAAWLAAGLLASQVEIETDILSLVPRDNKVVDGFRTTIERFGSVDTLLVVVHLEPDRPLAEAVEFADRMAAMLREWELIDWVEYRVESSAEAAVPLLDRAALFLDPVQLDEVLASLEGEGLERTVARLRGQLMAPQGVVTKELLKIDPAGLLPRILSRVRFGGVGVRVDPQTGCLIDPGQRFLLMMAKPIRPAQDLEFDRALVDGLEQRVAALSAAWMDEYRGEPALQVEFTGGYVVSLDDARLITSDMVVGLVSSLVGVMLLFLLAFRSRAALVYAFVPLVTGIALTFIFGALALGRINSLTSAFGGLVIGLGIDFVIVLYARYVEERRRGAGHQEAVDAMGRHTGVGVLLGAVTTAATFYSFLVTDFAGLWELGLLTGTGILLLVATVYLVLPALLTLVEERRPRQHRPYLHSFGSDLLCQLSLRRPLWTMAVAVAVTVALAFAVRDLRWDDDFRNMRSGDNRAIELRDEVMDAFELRFSPMILRFDAATEEEALARCRAVLPALERLVDGENLAGIDTIAGVIPPAEQQQALIARLERAAPEIEGLKVRFESSLRAHGLNPTAFEEGIDHLVEALERRQMLSLADLEGTPLARVIDRYVVRAGGEVSAAIYLYPPVERWRQGASEELLELAEAHPGAVLAGINLISAELRRIVWDDAIKALALGLVVVFVLMWADLGGPVRALLALLPLLVGMVWMLGGMALLGVRLNFFNIFVLTMIVGIGVDYGVHLLHRWYETDGDHAQVGETAKAIAVASLTTIVGFGSLVLSHYPGLRSVGAAAILGAVSTAVLGITVLPALLRMKERTNDP